MTRAEEAAYMAGTLSLHLSVCDSSDGGAFVMSSFVLFLAYLNKIYPYGNKKVKKNHANKKNKKINSHPVRPCIAPRATTKRAQQLNILSCSLRVSNKSGEEASK